MTKNDAKTMVKITGWCNVAVGTVHGFLAAGLLVLSVLFRHKVETYFVSNMPEISDPVMVAFDLTVILIALIIVFSICEIVAAIFLFRYSETARKLSVSIAWCNLLNLPLGTVVGALSLWVLTRPEVRELFEQVWYEDGGHIN